MIKRRQKNKEGRAYNHVLKYTSLFGGVQGMNVIASIVRNKIVSKCLGSVGLGSIDIYNHAMSFLSNATTFGVPFTAVRSISELYDQGDEDRLRAYVKVIRSWSVVTALLGMLVCALAAPWISRIAFGDASYTWRCVQLSPIVGMLAISGVEMAILKGVRRLNSIAAATMLGTFLTLALTVPFYIIMGMEGIIPALLLSTAGVMVVNLSYTLRIFRWQAAPFSWRVLSQGTEMLKLGVSYLLAGIVASATEMAVRSFIVNQCSVEEEGFYSAGFVLTVSYSRFILVSMEADYFPRLSAICRDIARANEAINRQLEVCVLLIAPCLIIFSLFLPNLTLLLYRDDFIVIVPMTLCATFYMFFKAITTPIAYSALAHGDSVTYFIVELTYYVAFAAFVMLGYSLWGLVGAGIGLSLSNLFDLLLVSTVYRAKYGFRFSRKALLISFGQGALLATGVWMAFQNDGYLRYGLGLPVFTLSAIWSLRSIVRETTMLSALRERLRRSPLARLFGL